MNMTQQVMDGKGYVTARNIREGHSGGRSRPSDIPLRFLIHFMGDLHQPLHLSGRDRGGNQGASKEVMQTG